AREGSNIRDRFEVVNAAAVPIVGATNESAEALVGTEALPNRAGCFNEAAAIYDGGISTHPANVDGRALTRSLGHKIHGTADTIRIHVGLQGLVDFHGLDDVSRNGIQLDLAHSGFRGRRIDAINGEIGKA